MTLVRFVLKAILLLTLAVVVFVKFETPRPDWWFELSTDAVILFILLGAGDVVLKHITLRISAFLPTKSISNPK